jgi:hypothetical protein
MKLNIFLSIFIIIFAIKAQGATQYVTPSGAVALDGTSWANAFPGTSLQAAITASNVADEVWVAAGIYYTTTTTNRTISFSMKNGVTICGRFIGTETLVSQRTLTNGLTSILSGEIAAAGIADNSYKVIYNEQLDTTGADGNWMTADDDLQLLNSSLCIDVVDNTGVSMIDILSNNRIFNTTVDMGSV